MLSQSKTPTEAQAVLLQDAVARDRATARRVCLLEILWQERYLTRAGLISRVEGRLGQGCFGVSAWEDTYFRDMRVVKKALKNAGYILAYSRRRGREGYYLKGEGALHTGAMISLTGSVQEVDPRQIAVYRRLSPADRFRQGCSISDTARAVTTFREQNQV